MRTDRIILELAVVAMMLGAGLLLGLLDRRRFSPGWLVVACGLMVVNDVCLTRGYGLLPRVIGGDWNWQGKLLALAATLAIAALPAFGWRRAGLTLAQKRGSLPAAVPVALVYALFFVALALVFPRDGGNGETLAFQLTMPGLEEEPFYRGILLLALDRAFRGRVRLLGVEWGWGAVLSTLLFGLAHALDYGDGAFSFDPLTMTLVAVPALLGVWLRYRTGSLLLPVLLHNFGNSIGVVMANLA